MAGKVVLVTGAGGGGEDLPGIGQTIAAVLAAEGAAVACLDLDPERARHTADAICRSGGKAIALAGDVASAADCARAAAEAQAALGPVTVLVNNAGINLPLMPGGDNEAAWRRVLDVNLTGAMLMARAVIPAMARAGGGAIVNVASLAGHRAYGTLAYGPSKAGLMALTRELAVLHGREGVRCNSVSPGHMATAFVAGHLSDEARRTRQGIAPLGIEGTAMDVARAVLFLASDEARFITAADLAVDGGAAAVGALTAHAMAGARG